MCAAALCWTAALAACALSVPLGVAASTGGRIDGRVVDHTAPHHPVARQAVRLTIIERGASSGQDAISDAAGRFQFTGLPVEGMRVFVLSTEYRGVRYTSDRIVLGSDGPARTVDLVVYESSPHRASIRGTVALAIVDVARGAARVSVVQGLMNGTDRTVVAMPDDPIVFPLPPRAEMVTTLGGWRDPRVALDRITDTLPLMPGRAQVAYAYGLEVKGAELAVPWSFPYGAEDVEVLVADAGMDVIADGLAARDTVTGPNGRYLRWSGGPVGRGGHVVLRLRGVPSASDPWPAAVAAGLGLVLLGGLAKAVRQSRPRPT
jgi:hypothetical protein